jgi:hypothetical protein
MLKPKRNVSIQGIMPVAPVPPSPVRLPPRVGNLERFGGALRLDLDTLPPFLHPFIFVAILYFFLTEPPFL